MYRSALDKADERGQKFELPDELLGLAGFRAVKIDPLRTMGFEISKYQAGKRDARREFTGGAEGVLKGGELDPNQIIRQYFIANQALFNVKKNMHDKVKASQVLGVDEDNLAAEFKKRQIPVKEFGQLNEGIFVPYFPSKDILLRFQEIADQLGIPNQFEDVESVIETMYEDFADQPLDEPFEFRLENYMTPVQPTAAQAPLPPTPMPNPQVVASIPAIQNVSQTGLTLTEQALLSPEEQQIRLRQRGLA